jgi:hypothetical protein
MTGCSFSQGLVELDAGADVQLGGHLAQVPLHGAAADEQLCGDLGVGSPVTGQLGDLLLSLPRRKADRQWF